MTRACDCDSKPTCIPRLRVAGQGRSEESPGWRFCHVRPGDGRSLLEATVSSTNLTNPPELSVTFSFGTTSRNYSMLRHSQSLPPPAQPPIKRQIGRGCHNSATTRSPQARLAEAQCRCDADPFLSPSQNLQTVTPPALLFASTQITRLAPRSYTNSSWALTTSL
jgi:hypothetical protein